MKGFHSRTRFWAGLAAAGSVAVVVIVVTLASQVPQVSAGFDAPEWLQASVARYVGCVEGKPTSAEWVETTYGQYSVAVGAREPAEAKAIEASAQPVYVVVLHGHFVSNMSHPESRIFPYHPLEGQVLVLTFDPDGQELTNIDLLCTEGDFDEGSLGQTNPLAL
jgi:hypothetical protein